MEDILPSDIARINEKHFAVTFLLDTSGSMSGQAIDSLNDGLNSLIQSLKDDSNADIIDIAVITFGNSVEVVEPHTPVSRISLFNFTAGGATPMGEALLKAAEITNERRRQYKYLGVDAFKPWIFMITDGAPTDPQIMIRAKEELMRLQNDNKLKLWVLGVPGYSQKDLIGLVNNNLILELEGFNLASVLNWVNKSIVNVSHSTPGQSPKMAELTADAECHPIILPAE